MNSMVALRICRAPLAAIQRAADAETRASVLPRGVLVSGAVEREAVGEAEVFTGSVRDALDQNVALQASAGLQLEGLVEEREAVVLGEVHGNDEALNGEQHVLAAFVAVVEACAGLALLDLVREDGEEAGIGAKPNPRWRERTGLGGHRGLGICTGCQERERDERERAGERSGWGKSRGH